MSFIITINVREGIVMASDSRLTLSTTKQAGQNQIHQLAVGQSDSNYKTFLTPQKFGISICGQAEINRVPIAGYVESFIREKLKEDTKIDEVGNLILEHFRNFTPIPKTQFHVAGYKVNLSDEQHVWLVDIEKNQTNRVNVNVQGATWGGEGDILARLLNRAMSLDNNGKPIIELPHFGIPYEFFTLQDAIDFCIFAVRSTIDAIRFQPRPKTVGGPIDVLVIKPENAFWIQRKELIGTK